MTSSFPDSMPNRCSGCAREAPSCFTAHTLIGKHGWRSSMTRTPAGAILQRWCATCWAKRRARMAAQSASR